MDSNSTTPGISLTPSADVQQKSRSRAGTLPSSFIHGSSPAGFNQSHSPLNAIGNSEPLGIPYMDSFTLGIPASSPPLEKGGMDIPGSNGSTRRMRSGSLFSTNSIWNDDALQHSPSQGNGPSLLDNSSVHSGSNSNGGSFFSPALGPQQYQGTVPQSFSAMHGYPPQSTLSAGAQTNRNRSYTTTGAVPVSAGMPSMASQATPLHVVDPSGQSRLSTSPFHGSLSQSNDMNVLLDNLMASMNTMHNRNRAQTFSGAPAEADAVLLKQLILAQNYLIQQEQQQEQARNQILAQQPVLQDDIDFSDFRITTNFDNPNLGPTNFLLFDNLPNFIDSIKLWSILSNSLGTRAKGSIKSLKVTTTKSSKLALVECCSVEIAMTLKANFNHLELVPGITLYAAFALVLDKSPTEQNVAKTNNSKTSPNSKGRRTESPTKSLPIDLVNIQLSLLSSVALIAPYDIDMNKVRSMIQSAIRYPNENYKANFGPLPEPIPLRQFDSPKLRELRKSLETCEKELSRPEVKNDVNETLVAPESYFAEADDYSVSHIENVIPEKSEQKEGHMMVPSSKDPLLSPRANAIKTVFNNPAMGNSKSILKKYGVTNSSVQFIDGVTDDIRYLKVSPTNKISSSSDNDSYLSDSTRRILPKSPVPSKELIGKLGFKDVFVQTPTQMAVHEEHASDDDDDSSNDDEDDEGDETYDNDVASLEHFEIKKITSSSTNSSEASFKEGSEEYQTRSSSIISGINGDYKFTLNLNDSNLLMRRRSSTVRSSKSGGHGRSSLSHHPPELTQEQH